MGGLIQWIQQNTSAAVLVMNVIIALVAIVSIGFLIVKAINKFRAGKAGDAFKDILYGVLIVIIAVVSVVGVIKLGQTIKPDTISGNNSFGALGDTSMGSYVNAAAVSRGVMG